MVSNAVPIRNELVNQLMRCRGAGSTLKVEYFAERRLTRKYDVFFCPVMNLPAMRASQARTIELGAFPGRFLNGPAGGGEFAGGRAAHQNAFDRFSVRRFVGTLEIIVAHQSR